MNDVRERIMREARAPKPGGGKLPSRVPDARVAAGTNGIVLAVRCIGPNFTLWGNVPAAWAAAATRIRIYAVAGRVRALAGPLADFIVPAAAGQYQLANLQFATAGADSIEVEVIDSPAAGPAVEPLLLCGVSWYFRGEGPKEGESVW